MRPPTGRSPASFWANQFTYPASLAAVDFKGARVKAWAGLTGGLPTMRAIFLDIDGVLNCKHTQSAQVSVYRRSEATRTSARAPMPPWSCRRPGDTIQPACSALSVGAFPLTTSYRTCPTNRPLPMCLLQRGLRSAFPHQIALQSRSPNLAECLKIAKQYDSVGEISDVHR
jgi:hypothetical protein